MIIIFIILYRVLFLVGIQYMKKLNLMMGNKKSSTSLIVPYFVGIAEFLTNVIPLICRSFRLMMNWYSVESFESTVAESVDVQMIWHGFSPPGERTDTDSIDNTNIEIITRNNGRSVIIEEWEKLEAIASNALL